MDNERRVSRANSSKDLGGRSLEGKFYNKESMGNVKPHSRQKHVFLETYLDIWAKHVKKNPPTLDIFDLFADYGMCKCEEEDSEWEGSALIAVKCLCEYPKGQKLWLNSYNLNPEEMAEQHEGLRGWLSNLDIPSRVDIIIEGRPVEEAVDFGLKELEPKFPSLWILDPYQPDHLPWTVVEKIARAEGRYVNAKGKIITRRPELFITLMTGRLQALSGHSDGQEEKVGIALGMSTEEWKQLIASYGQLELNTREAIEQIYSDRLESIYGVQPIVFPIPSVHGNFVYSIFLITERNEGRYMMLVKKFPEYYKWWESEYAPKVRRLKKRRKAKGKAKRAGLTSLDSFGT